MNEPKGITPVISVILLIGISFFAVASVYSVVSDTQESFRDSLEQRLQDERQEQRTEISFERVYEGDDGNTLIDVRNTGATSIMMIEEGSSSFNLYVDGMPASNDEVDAELEFLGEESDDLVLGPQEMVTADTSHQFPNQGESVNYELVGPDGVSDSHNCLNHGDGFC